MRISPTRTLSFACIVLMGCFLEGCMEFGRLDYTRPSTVKTESSETIHNYKYPEIFPLALKRTNLELAVASSAESTTYLFCPFPCSAPLIPWIPGILHSWLRATNYEPDPPLWIELWIVPHGGQISIDTRRVTLRTSDGNELIPTGQEGPGSLLDRQNDHQSGLSNSSHSCSLALHVGSNGIFGQVSEHEIIITKPVCLRLGFRLSAVPTMPFFLQIDGLSKEGERIPISAIQFERTTRKALWRIL